MGSKYRAIRTKIDGITFASKKEASRYIELRLLEQAGEISGLKLQVPFRLVVNGELICKYICDFQYVENGKQIIEDSKGVRTSAYVIKRKLMHALFGITILET